MMITASKAASQLKTGTMEAPLACEALHNLNACSPSHNKGACCYLKGLGARDGTDGWQESTGDRGMLRSFNPSSSVLCHGISSLRYTTHTLEHVHTHKHTHILFSIIPQTNREERQGERERKGRKKGNWRKFLCVTLLG